MSEFLEIFKPTFLLHNALWGSIAVGFFCPLIGVYFLLRRMVLVGLTLPQISAAGISFAFFLEGLGFSWSLHPGEAQDRFLALAGSLVFTLASIGILAYLERSGEGTTDSRLGATYATAFAAAFLLVIANPTGKIEVLNMLQGEIVSVTSHDLHILLGVYAALTLLIWLLKDQLLLVSFDREAAQVMGKKVVVWDLWLYGIIAIAISMSVLIVGPMLTFAFLIIPPLAARRFCQRMSSFFVLSCAIGGLSGFLGFYCSYLWDLPLAPTDIAVASAFLMGAVVVKLILNCRGRLLAPLA